MALERISVIENFVLENDLEPALQRLAKANAYILAARLVFFEPSIPARRYLAKAFYLRRSWPSQAKIYIVLYILLLPISRVFNSLILRLISWRR